MLLLLFKKERRKNYVIPIERDRMGQTSAGHEMGRDSKKIIRRDATGRHRTRNRMGRIFGRSAKLRCIIKVKK